MRIPFIGVDNTLIYIGNEYLAIILLFIAITCWLIWFVTTAAKKERKRRDQRLRAYAKAYEEAQSHLLELGNEALPANEFLTTAKNGQDFTGCYILHNATKDIYYVGQAVSVLQRVAQHLTGHGNGDVYADYKYGDIFTVKAVKLSQSGYDSLNELERDLIAAYDAYENGYNRTHGNRN